MRKTLLGILTFILCANQMLHIFGKVTILRGTTKTYLIYLYNRKLICFSEDDGGALVWNDNLIQNYYTIDRTGDRQFYSLNKFNNKKMDCELNTENSCLESWSRQNWSLTNSLKTPMGPVFDQRWEGFKEYENVQHKYNNINMLTASAAAISLSIRAAHDAHMLLCNGKDYNNNLCYWIIIGGWGNTLSVIRKCATGVPRASDISKCQKEIAVEHTPLSVTEWRTFVITWNSETRNISVYDTNKIIMTYVDMGMPARSSSNYHVFIGSHTMMLVRFHIYNFLHTTLQSAITSPTFQPANGTICMQLLVGLCAECDAHIILRDITTYEVLQTVIVNGSSGVAVHGLPMWQSVKIKTSFSTNIYNNVIIQLNPKLNTPSSNPLWAIANVRQCPPNGSSRVGVLYPKIDWTKQKGYFWPTLSCQKLFYEEHTIVDPMLDKPIAITQDIEFEDVECPEGKIGPQCAFSCNFDLESAADCKETAICNKNGCTCPSGFSGPSCSDSCRLNKYGHGCRKKCGTCIYKAQNSTQRTCSKTNGECYDGCNNALKTYVPPLCQISIDKPNRPVITFVTTTTIRAVVPILWKNEYKGLNIFYSFYIQDEILSYYLQKNWTTVFENTTQLIGYFENLKPGTAYLISCSLNIANVYSFSESQTTKTDCNEVKNFNITSEETSMMIDWQNDINQLYPCPPNWYYVMIRNVDADSYVTNRFATSFPYNIVHLKSYTTYNVTIRHEDHVLFSQEISTLEGVPSEILDLRRIPAPDSQLVLTWKPPNQPNGEILRYVVIVEVKKYCGCEDFKLPMPDSHIIAKSTTDTTIAILDLHPYTVYTVRITAHNSLHGSNGAEISVEMKRLEIPTEIFSHLAVKDWKLIWSPPEDCSMITGPIKARINIRGISDAVKDINVTKQTSFTYLNLDQIKPPLNSFEQYMAKIYIIRDFTSSENTSAYQECIFRTPSTAPPNVVNLEVIEIDTRQSPATIRLRWQSPRPPINGKLLNYAIESCEKFGRHCVTKKIQLNEFCDLWNDYICGTVDKSTGYQKIQVLVYNENITTASKTLVTEEMLDNIIPDIPGDYTFIINNNSVIDLKWRHPWKTGDHLQSFHIKTIEISSNLTKHVSQSSKMYIYKVTNYMRNYSKRLYLLPSTRYNIYIQAMTIANKSSSIKYVEVRTPSTTAFDGDLDVMVHKFDSTILLNIPSVLNDTRDSMMHIIIKGPHRCKGYSEVPENLCAQAGINMYDIAWQAAIISTNELAGELFTVGNNKTYGGARNCLLKSEETYEIIIIVTGPSLISEPIILTRSIRIGDEPSKHHEVWIISATLFFVVVAVVFYFYRRKNRNLRERDMYLL